MKSKNLWLEPWRKSFVIEGRASRREFWLFHLQFTILLLILTLGLLSFLFLSRESISGGHIAIGLFCALAMLLALIPAATVGVRRFHDIGKSGWEFLLWMLATNIPIFGFGVLAVVIIFVSQESQPGPNQYGENPLEEYNQRSFMQ